jgi:hypothetical protein
MAVLGALVSTVALEGPAGTAAAASVPACATSGLVIWLYTPPGNGAAGSTYYDVEFTNLSKHSCTLLGYPGVSAVNLASHQLGTSAARNNAFKPALVTLSRGASAIAVLQITDTGALPGPSCRPTTAAGLRVYPPSQTSSKVVPFPFQACSVFGPSYLHVEAVEKS